MPKMKADFRFSGETKSETDGPGNTMVTLEIRISRIVAAWLRSVTYTRPAVQLRMRCTCAVLDGRRKVGVRGRAAEIRV